MTQALITLRYQKVDFRIMRGDILYPIRRLHGIVYEFVKKAEYWVSYILPFGKKVFIIGTPVHGNLGDSAIVIAQIEFLKKSGYRPERIKEITISDYRKEWSRIRRLIHKKGLICFPGGGNMGNLWPDEDEFRFSVMRDLPQNRFIMFPQTVFFTPDKDAEAHKLKTIKYYNNPNITLVAREKESFKLMEKLYPKAKILLTPDMVLSADMNAFGAESNGQTDEILFCFRNDIERVVSEGDADEIKTFVSKQGFKICSTDTHKGNNACVTSSGRRDDVREKLGEFSRARLVVTDRLHGMVFAAIAGTPCIAFDNKSDKVRGTYEWISYLPYIKFAENTEEAKAMLSELLKMGRQTFDNEPLKKYFRQITKELQKG